MKKFLKSLRSRLSDAMSILFCGRYFLLRMKNRHATEKTVLFGAAFRASRRYLSLVCDDSAAAEARLDMLTAVLDADASVVLFYKENGQCLVSYDCLSQSDLDELLNQEVL